MKKVSRNSKIDTDIRRYLTHVERDLGIDIRIYFLHMRRSGSTSLKRKSEKQKMEMKKENKYDTTRTVRNLQK